MQVPLELVFREVPRTAALEELVRAQVDKLHQVSRQIESVHVAVERPNALVSSGSGYRVRIEVRVSSGPELVTTREPSEGDVQDELQRIIRDAFAAMWRRLQKFADQRRGDVKHHEDRAVGVVSKLFADFGFLVDVAGREIYFHKNSVLRPGFENLRVGTSVSYTEEMGDEGPQASSVHVEEQ